ncbi:uncharacterized protein YecT (DUF1311 family) [Pseudochelatococcus lubricantis]|uniref:Uncharacterized protein YecT (DUF1311 family) n=1 Tax=Pseudochelatococcus lubricantis TaxID=1538102 RepID=A0ABX0V5K8_9HYPH|nr:uncharacterized protein YecT (DUF1311 family) [Pseudochelatococcus lubricantis]
MKRFSGLALSAIAFLVAASGSALADAAYDQCIAKADGTNTAWAQCGGDWVAREDAKLNKVWHQVYGQTDGQTKTDLLAEQRLWNAYKESSCNFYANGDWGREGQVLNFSECRAKVIAARTGELQEYGRFFSPK